MFFTGYLTYEGKRNSLVAEEKLYGLKIPNKEVKSFFRSSFVDIYTHGNTTRYVNMLEELMFGRIDTFPKKFKELYKNAISYHDTAENEKYYHHFMLGLLLTLNNHYIITSNRESGEGRYDIELRAKDKQYYSMIFEFKLGSKGNLEKKAKNALEQIESKGYDTNLKAEGINNIIKIGIAFYEKDIAVAIIASK